MKFRISIYIIGVLLAALVLPGNASSSAQVSSTVLPNKMKVIVREGHAVNLVAVDVWVLAGSVNETDANNGISHFVEHMIFKATSKYGPGEADREIEGLGAELNGGTSKDWVHFYTTVASEYLPTALDVLSDAITNAQFRPEDVDKERKILTDELARADSNPSQRAFSLFSRTAFTSHPYRLPQEGTREAIAKLTRDGLVAYYNRYYTPANTIVSIAGDISSAEAVSQVQKAFGRFGRPSVNPPVPADEPPVTAPRVKQFESQTNQAYVVLGYIVPPGTQFRDACALDVVLALLGDTYRGRVSAALTAKGIQFGDIETDFISQRYQSTISTFVSVEPKDVDAVTDVLRNQYEILASEPVPDGELDYAKRVVEGGDLFDQETFSGQARALGLYAAIASHDLALTYGPTVRSITASEVSDVARRCFGASNYCLAKIEPRKGQGN